MSVARGNVLAVVGGQFGSEGKGVIVNHIADRFEYHVRVGGPNAGHSLNHKGTVYKMQALPCGWTNPDAQLFIARGALVDPIILTREIEMLRRLDPSITKRIKIDRWAGVISKWHHTSEGGVDGELHARIGSTGEGVGAARKARIARDPNHFRFIEEVADEFGGADDRSSKEWSLRDCLVDDVSRMLIDGISIGRHCLLEGTQGAGLSLIHGAWPYVTSADTNAAQMAADVGLPPRFINRTLLVVRSHPIRVAGNSGPLLNEITWSEVSRRVGKPVEEKTTVTKKIRRVGEWDEDLFINAVKLNAPTSLAFTFADYISPVDEGKRSFGHLSMITRNFINYLESTGKTPVSLIGTGGPTWAVVERGIAL
jgi:adenylosuccinate synthase